MYCAIAIACFHLTRTCVSVRAFSSSLDPNMPCLCLAPRRDLTWANERTDPAVGSICGTSNAAVARALGAPVLLVGRKGVGDAVDSYNLNSTFFRTNGCRVLGAVFNRYGYAIRP